MLGHYLLRQERSPPQRLKKPGFSQKPGFWSQKRAIAHQKIKRGGGVKHSDINIFALLTDLSPECFTPTTFSADLLPYLISSGSIPNSRNFAAICSARCFSSLARCSACRRAWRSCRCRRCASRCACSLKSC